MIILWFVIKFRTKRDSERSGVKIDSQRVCSEKSGTLTPVCVSHTAGCWVLDSKPAPEIMYQYAQGAEKGLTATQKNNFIKQYIYFNQHKNGEYSHGENPNQIRL